MEMFNGKKYHRVSEVLNPFSGYHNVPEFVLQKAQERGDIVHRYIENNILQNQKPVINEDLQGYIDSYHQYKIPGEVVSIEQRFYDDRHLLTGKGDCIVQYEGKYILLDWKTSQKENRTWAMQGSAYAWLAMSHYPIDEIKFIKLDKKGGVPIVYEYQKEIDNFFKCFYTYKMFFEKTSYPIFDD